jgi:hypothetical protein
MDRTPPERIKADSVHKFRCNALQLAPTAAERPCGRAAAGASYFRHQQLIKDMAGASSNSCRLAGSRCHSAIRGVIQRRHARANTEVSKDEPVAGGKEFLSPRVGSAGDKFCHVLGAGVKRIGRDHLPPPVRLLYTNRLLGTTDMQESIGVVAQRKSSLDRVQ